MSTYYIPAAHLSAKEIGADVKFTDTEHGLCKGELRQVYHTGSETVLYILKDDASDMAECIVSQTSQVQVS